MLVANLGELFILTWFFVTGSVLGSFLNVVIYRVPRGLSLVHPPSRCPVCLHPIRWHDNVPILGWFLLRGRCRDCGARIAIRYPVVEALAGLDVLLVALTTGEWRWVPTLDSLLREGVVQPAVTDTAVFVGFSLSLLAAALILYDGARVPMSFWVTSILLVLIGHLASSLAINRVATPPLGPTSSGTTAAPARISGESRVGIRLPSVVEGSEKHVLPFILSLAGGVLIDVWINKKARPGRTSKRLFWNGAGIVDARFAKQTREKQFDSGEPERTELPRKSPPSGGEYSFACAICGWTFGQPTEAGILIAFLAAVTSIAICMRQRRCNWSRHPQEGLASAAAHPTSTPDGDPRRIRSIPMFALWLFFLGWVVVR